MTRSALVFRTTPSTRPGSEVVLVSLASEPVTSTIRPEQLFVRSSGLIVQFSSLFFCDVFKLCWPVGSSVSLRQASSPLECSLLTLQCSSSAVSSSS